MPLYKRSGSDVYWADISLPGRRRLRESTGQTDRQTAQRKHDELTAALWNEPAELAGNTFGKAVNRWLDVEPRSQSEMLSLRKFGAVFADRPLAKVTPEAIHEALGFCKTAGTYTRYGTMLSAILRLSGLNIKLLSRKDKKKKTRTWLTYEQWDKLYAELPAHLKPMAKFAVETGLRQANVLGLQWSRVDLAGKLVWIEANDMKADEALSIPLSSEAVAALQSQVGQDKVFVFTFRGKPIKDIKTAFMAACIRAGVGKRVGKNYEGFTWHGLRHTWATWHMKNETPIEVLQELGGWHDLRMVMNYAHHSPGHLARFADNQRKKT
jgi:integrase